MRRMNHLRRVAIYLALPIVGCVGCGRAPDERLAEFAQQAVAEQRKQNDRIADQSQAVVEESHQLAQAAKELVKRDAEARRELIGAQKELTTQLNEQQSAIHIGHQQLEQDRHEIAEHRHRDPVIAAVIQNVGLTLACLLPLLVAVFVIRQMQSQEPDHAAVAELLTRELTSDEPLLLPRPMSRHATLNHEDAGEAHHTMIAGDSTNDVKQPF